MDVSFATKELGTVIDIIVGSDPRLGKGRPHISFSGHRSQAMEDAVCSASIS